MTAFVDFHAHLDLSPHTDRDLGLLDASSILTVSASMDFDSWQANLALAARSPLIVPTFGIHPARALAVTTLDGWRDRADEAVAASNHVGEIGLDGIWCPDVPPGVQLEAFRFMLDRALAHGRLVVVHSKEAEDAVADEISRRDLPGVVIHWFSGTEQQFRRLVDLGCHFTFGCETGRNALLAAYAAACPADRLLAETDNPVGEPWLGGSDDSPALIRRVYDDIAAARGMGAGELAALVNANSLRLLGRV